MMGHNLSLLLVLVLVLVLVGVDRLWPIRVVFPSGSTLFAHNSCCRPPGSSSGPTSRGRRRAAPQSAGVMQR